MVRLELNGHPNFMKDGKILLSPNEDNRLSWTEDGKLTAVGGTTFRGGTPGNAIAGTGGVGENGLKGDITLDGVVDENDATKVLDVASKHGTGYDYDRLLSSKQQWAGDFNSDTEINATDASLILQYTAANGGSIKANQLSKPLSCDSSVSRLKQAITDTTMRHDGVYMPNLVRSILSNPNLSTQQNSVVVTEHDVQIVEKVEKADTPGEYIEQLVTPETEAIRLINQKTDPTTGKQMTAEEYTKMVNDSLQKASEATSTTLKSDDYDYSKWKDSSFKQASQALQANVVKMTAKNLKTIGESSIPIGWSSGEIKPLDTSVLEVTIGTAMSGQKYYPTTTTSTDAQYQYQSGVNMYGGGSSGSPISQYQNGPLITVINSVVLAYDAAGISGQSGSYSQTKTVKITVNGNTFSARPDCSGLIQAVLTAMGYNASGLNSNGLVACTGIKYANGTMSNDWEFIRNPSIYQIQAGDFLARNGHAEIGGCIVNSKLYGWNFGEDGPIRRTISAVKNMINTNLSESDLQNAFVKAGCTLGNSGYSVLIRYKGYGSSSSTTTTTTTTPTSTVATSNFKDISDSDFILLCNCVAHEAGSNSISIEEKAKVVEVIMNRVADPRFPNSIRGVITQPSQFTGSSKYSALSSYSSKVTNMVKESVNYYFSNKSEFNHGYLYFYGDGKQNHFSVEYEKR
jgi:hypothetical protein